MSNEFKDNLKYPKKYTNPEQIELLENKFFDLMDEYEKNNSYENREFLCHLTSAIYLTYRKLYPRLSIYIPFRTKSDISFIKNLKKEFNKYVKNTESQEPFDPETITKDISGLRIVLNDINNSLPTSEFYEELLSDPEIAKLQSTSKDNHNFIDSVDEYLRSPIHNGKQYFELKRELLKEIIHITPEEFTDERKPNPSFSKLYEEAKYQYDYFLENDSFPTVISSLEITELTNLATEFRSRIDDQLHFAILRKTLPVVFNEPLIKNALKTSFKYEKEAKKPNGFQSCYYSFETPFGPVEVQAQSNKAYFTSTKGSSYHSGMAGKNVDIKEFFELVDSNDPYDISYYLDILDTISADKSLVSPYELPDFKTEEEKSEFLKTPKGLAFIESEKYREMMKHIRIKDTIEINSIELDTNEYLLSTALSLSPYMNVCGSGHTSFTTAGIHHKKVIGEFAEVLRKRDANTCLRDMLIRKLEQIIDNPPENPSANMRASLQIVKEHDEIANKLPKDISHKNILSYAEKIRERKKENIEIDSEYGIA